MKIFTVLFLFATTLSSQHYQTFECPVSIDGKSLAYPFTGGFSNAQFSEYDFDQDGLLDLFVFDKQGDASMVFLRNASDNSFSFTKKYNQYLPLSITSFCLVNDFNRDGVVDLFTSGVPIGVSGVMLFEGSTIEDGFGFKVRKMGRADANSAPALWNRLDGAQVYVAPTDIPAIADVDFDGDLDILSFDSGGSYVIYNRNFQVENGFSKDTMDFRVDDICFGKFEEGGLSQEISLSTDPALCAFEPRPNINNQISQEQLKSGGLHSGSTVLAFDPDEDSDTDLILGDLLYNGLVYLNNGGSANQDLMTDIDETFPSYSLPANMNVFLSSFSIDVDNDGLKDILTTPNAIGKIQDFNSIWYYKNNGVGPNQFSLRKKNFLQEETIDFGSFTSPTFIDYNADGLMDILVGQGGSLSDEDVNMSLVLFENTGTKKNPSFELVDHDYLGFSEFKTTSNNPSPTFGDLDSDGDLDLIIGDNVGNLYYYENIAGAGQTLDFANKVFKYMDINVGNGAKPYLVDFDQDGLMDLVIGEERTNGFEIPGTQEFITGNLNYFKNIGKASEPLFNNDVFNPNNTSALGRIKVSFALNTAVDGGAAPVFFTKDDKLNVIVGSKTGRMVHHQFNSTDPIAEAPIVNDYLGFLKEGNDSSPALFDINNDGFFEILIGTSRGGLVFYNTDIETGTSSNTQVIVNKDIINVFPNPTNSIVTIEHKNYKSIDFIEVISAAGRLVKKVSNKNEVDLSKEAAGIYYLKIRGKDFNVVKTISLIK